MSAPDFAMRIGMLKLRLATAKVDDASLDISEEILNHVARTVTGSGRELEGAFNQLLFRQSFEPQITIDRIDEILGHIYRSGEPKRVRIEDIQRIVARHYNVSKTELLSNRRTRTIVKPRQVAMYLSKVMTPRSLPEIGRRFGGRDHTTVLHAVRKIEDLSGNDNTLAQELELLRRLINDQAWLESSFIPTVQQRGAAIIEARGASSAASAANATVDHMRDWVLGTAEGDWVSMSVPSDGSYGIAEGIITSFPCTTSGGDYSIVQGLEINEFSQSKIDASVAELQEEREAVRSLGLVD
jgi:hypothetical protein